MRQSDVEDAHEYSFNCIKQGFHGRAAYPKGSKGLIDAIAARKDLINNMEIKVIPAPGINPYKQIELYTKFGDLMPEAEAKITCPMPSKEIWEYVEKEKKSNLRIKDEKRAAKKDVLKRIQKKAKI